MSERESASNTTPDDVPAGRASDKLKRNMPPAERTGSGPAITNEAANPKGTTNDPFGHQVTDRGNLTRTNSTEDPVRGGRESERDRQNSRGQDQRRGHVDALVPARHLPDLTEFEIGARLQSSSRLADKRADIENLAKLVFGNTRAVSAAVDRVADTRSGASAGDDVREGRLGEFAGEGRKWLRNSSPERQTAEANAPRLAAALADYGRAVDFERHQISSQHREQQARQRAEIPRPSAALSEMLPLDKDARNRRISENTVLNKELDRLATAFGRRLMPEDRAALRAGHETKKLATELGIGLGQARALGRIYDQVTGAQDNIRRINKELARTNQVQITR